MQRVEVQKDEKTRLLSELQELVSAKLVPNLGQILF
jgi:hypothetical protein